MKTPFHALQKRLDKLDDKIRALASPIEEAMADVGSALEMLENPLLSVYGPDDSGDFHVEFSLGEFENEDGLIDTRKGGGSFLGALEREILMYPDDWDGKAVAAALRKIADKVETWTTDRRGPASAPYKRRPR